MNPNLKAALVFTGVQAIALGSQALSSPVSEGQPTSAIDPSLASYASFASQATFEESWLRLPDTCKARVFNADPAPSTREAATAELNEVYQSFLA